MYFIYYCLVRDNRKIQVQHLVHDIQKIISQLKSDLIYINNEFIETLAFGFFCDILIINIMFCYCLIT